MIIAQEQSICNIRKNIWKSQDISHFLYLLFHYLCTLNNHHDKELKIRLRKGADGY